MEGDSILFPELQQPLKLYSECSITLATADIPLAMAINMIRVSIDIIVFIICSDCMAVFLLLVFSILKASAGPEALSY